MVALRSKRAIVPIILAMTADAAGRQNDLRANRSLVAINALERLVFAFQLEPGLVVIEIPVSPVTGVVAGLASRSKRALVHILLLVTRPALRLGLLERDGQVAFLALGQNMPSGERETRHPMVEIGLLP